MNDDLDLDLKDGLESPIGGPAQRPVIDYEAIKAKCAASVEAVNRKIAEGNALDRETKGKVFAGEMKCPVCNGCGSLYYEKWSEQNRYPYRCSRRCWCESKRVLWQTIEQYVPSGYLHMALGKKPTPCGKSKASTAFQEKVINLVVANPRQSFAFFGPAGVGKTALSMWLLIDWIKWLANSGVYPGGYVNTKNGCFRISEPLRSSASKLVRQHHAYVTADDKDEADEPDITVEQVAAATRPMVWIAELEKIGPMTEYKYEVLFSVIDAIYEKRPSCQLVMDSNLRRDDFEAYFTDKIGRRVSELCYVVDYFTEEIFLPTDEVMR